MSLSNDLVSQFVKTTNDEKETKSETTVYGTTVEYNGSMYVKLDGSDILTPITTTADVKADERVTVMIKNHTATVTGNISSPSARTDDVKEIGTKITEVEILVADKVSTEELEAANGRIDNLVSDNVTIKDKLTANEAHISELQADNADIKGKLTANEASIGKLETDKLDASIAEITYATITDLQATNVQVNNLEATHANFENTTTTNLEAVNASIKTLETEKLSAEDADLKYANIDFANIGEAAIENFYAKSGTIENMVISDGQVTGTLVGVTIKGDLIEGGTIVADKLVIKGDDGLYYKLNTDGVTTEAEQTDYNSLNGSIIAAQSITATKIAVDDLVAFDATIGGFNITDNSLYSGVKSSADNTTRGIFLGNDGQIAFGDASNYLKYYKDENGNFRLSIASGGKTVEEAINDVEQDVDNIQIGGRNLLKWTGDLRITETEDGTDGISKYKSNVGTLTATEDGVKLTFDSSVNAAISIPLVYDGCIENNEEITLSFDYRGNITNPGEFYFMQRTSPNVSNNLNALATLTANETQWQHYQVTFTNANANARTNYRVLLFYNNESYTPSNWIEIKAGTLKLEKGNKATDWTPAPEDMATKEELNKELASVNETIKTQRSEILQESNSIILSALEEYVKTGDLEEYKTSVESELSVMADKIEMNFSKTTEQITTVDGDVKTLTDTINKYFEFSIDGLNIKCGEGVMSLRLDNDIVIFEKNEEEFGWWDGIDFHTGNIVVNVEERAQFGTFAFVPRSDGSLSFLKVSDLFPDPVITVQPESKASRPNYSVTLSVVATGQDLTYQWQHSDDQINWKTAERWTASTITFVWSGKQTVKYYRCIIRDKNRKKLVSNIASVTTKS